MWVDSLMKPLVNTSLMPGGQNFCLALWQNNMGTRKPLKFLSPRCHDNLEKEMLIDKTQGAQMNTDGELMHLICVHLWFCLSAG